MYYWIYETDNSLLVQPLKVIKETPKTVTIAATCMWFFRCKGITVFY